MSSLDADTDALAAESASFAPCIRVRDAAYIRWRWLEQPGGVDWQLHEARDRFGALCGIVVFGVDDSGAVPINLGRIVDLVARDAGTTRALLGTACDDLAARGCGAVTFYYSDPRPWARRSCLLSGFVPRAGPVLYGGSPFGDGRPYRLRDWYLTHGDTDVV